ncbi:MAG: sigma-70 family RNA polymerase sigma factor [Flavobacteriales bacterium]
MTEAEIIEQLQSERGRKQVFEYLLDTFQKPVYFYVRRMVVDHDDADDVTQQAFIKAWKGLEKFRGESKLSTWLYRIAYNESITFLGKKNKRNEISTEQIMYSMPSVLQEDALFDGDEIEALLQSAVATLPEKQKAVFVMKYYEEKKYEEISMITGTSVGALKATFHIAVGKIEQLIKGKL